MFCIFYRLVYLKYQKNNLIGLDYHMELMVGLGQMTQSFLQREQTGKFSELKQLVGFNVFLHIIFPVN